MPNPSKTKGVSAPIAHTSFQKGQEKKLRTFFILITALKNQKKNYFSDELNIAKLHVTYIEKNSRFFSIIKQFSSNLQLEI